MDEINYQLSIVLLECLVHNGFISELERDQITALLKEKFQPFITLLTG